MKKKIVLIMGYIFFMGSLAQAAYPERKVRFFGALDYYSVGNAADDMKDSIDITKALGPQTLSDSVETDPGYGARAGVRFPIPAVPSLDWGFSLGYVKGPRVTGKIGSDDLTNPGTPATAEAEVETNYTRFLLEGANLVHFNERVGLRLGVGLGVANAKTKQSPTNKGDPTIIFVGDGSKSKTGFTWEFSPAFVVNFEKTDLEIGLRYAQFPEIKQSDTTERIKKWSTFGFFVGASF